MTTTSQFQTKPNFFSSVEECSESLQNKQQTNLRYRNFTHTHFTAGDEEQFQHYRHDKNGSLEHKDIILTDNIFKNHEVEYWNGYEDLEATNVLETFRYLFHKFKKGIFVKIVGNELKVFLPFSNVNFINEWSEHISIDPKYGNIYNFIKHTNDMEGRNFYKNNINDFVNTWYGNNCLLRYEYPVRESDTNIPNIKDMLDELCKNRILPDIEFFINRRDFPLLTKNFTEPYYHLWDEIDKPLVSHKYERYVPILSMSKSDNYADVLIPSHEDWGRVQIKENKFFPRSHINFDCDNFEKDWDSKIPTAIFRGSSTGYGLDIETNQRLKVAYLSSIQDANEVPYLDAGITKWNTRPRKFMGQKYLQTIEVDKLPFNLVEKMSPFDQAKYKYIIHIEGHVSAFRLSYELNTNSVVLLVDSDWKLWYSNLLKPYVHYVPIKNDLSDLLIKIKWCRENDNKCRQIAKNASDFYSKYLEKKGIFDFMQKTLVDLKNKIGTYLYNYSTPLDKQLKYENDIILSIQEKSFKKSLDCSNVEIPLIKRSHGLLKGISDVLNSIDSVNDNINYIEDIFINKLGIIQKYEFKNIILASKYTDDSNKIKEHVHEAFVGMSCLNNLSKFIPNFMYVFGMYDIDSHMNVVTEFIDGQTLQQYIDSNDFNMNDYVNIITQICLALHVAQTNFGFVHNDLTTWNIVIRKLNEPETIDYIVEHKKVIRVKTSLIPVIIDYGKSHVIYDNTHRGIINMFKFSTVADILSILITSIYQIITEKQLPKYDFNQLLKLANFMSGSTFRKEPFTNSKDLKTFFHSMKKYSNLIAENKHELEYKTPLDLFNYIKKNIRYKFNLDKVNDYKPIYVGDSKQVFDFIMASNENERIQSYTNRLETIKKNCSSSKTSNNLLFTYYNAQTEYIILENLVSSLFEYLHIINVSSKKYELLSQQVINHFKNVNNVKISKLNIQNIHQIPKSIFNIKVENYNEMIFLKPETVNNLLNKNYKYNDISDYKNVISFILVNGGFFKIRGNHREWYLENLENILSLDTTKLKLYNANNNTLKILSDQLYTENLEEIKNIDNEDINKYRRLYNSILTL